MESSDGPVLMIVRASNSSMHGQQDVDTHPRPNGAQHAQNDIHTWNQISFGTINAAAAVEADWRQQQFQRQRMQLLSIAIFLCFLVLFLDNRNHQQTKYTNDSHNPSDRYHAENAWTKRQKYDPSDNYMNESDRKQKLNAFHQILKQQSGYSESHSSLSISGVYSGKWHASNADENHQQFNSTDIMLVMKRPFLRLDRDTQFQRYAQPPSEKGLVWLFLKMKTPATKEIMSDVAYVTGQFVIYEEKSSFAGTIMPVQGVFLRHLGQLTLFGNSPDATVQLVYKKPVNYHGNGSAINSTQPLSNKGSNDLTAAHKSRYKNDFSFGIPKIHQPEDYEALNISPPRYSFVTRFRSSDTFSDQCLSVIKLQLHNDTSLTHKKKVAATSKQHKNGDAETYEDMLRSMQFYGTLASENCGLYLSLKVSFEKKNLDKFFSKASHYAILMTLVSMAEIYFVLRQLQASSTQATATKVSLLTIGQQAILDSYLCLAHLTVGIIAQNVFTPFASVAFIKLIIFSVFEMRYLLVIWKARRPQGFSEGWIILRRELTTLYSRFYLSLLLGLVAFYNFSDYLPLLVFISYSFWIPQIVHNAFREVRNPFHAGYLYGMSALRMFIPLYFYGCPDNFLTEFPMLETKWNPSYCLGLTLWMAFQVGILTLQHRLGPQFFIPARFLPVKYNYERRLDIQQVSLVVSNDAGNGEVNTIDCVICMVELDSEARDYMLAPCDHVFHRECLQNWMQVKMECPTCRCALPEP
uniref:RING-type E3 ubiquitin transferase n=1 Tax=Albugo laibachii Nc14 TaxID=890382 RepID=F0WC83_9STRA|nr:conserved hypothetical protein [Albugo laibachii Nc14]|eukprot:CCA18796.1 conserved hypothetical protein [Albugo laibachii Nc14]